MSEKLDKAKAHIVETPKVQQLLDEVLEDGLVVMAGVLRWAEITPDMKGPPPEWIERYGNRAFAMFRAAQAANLPASAAPVGIKENRESVSAILRFRKEDAPRDLPKEFIVVEQAETLPTKRLKRE